MPKNIIQRFATALLEIIAEKAADKQSIVEASNLHVQVRFSIDGRQTGLDPEELSKILCEDISKIANEIEFETIRGSKFRRGRLVWTREVDVLVLNKTVDHNAAWDEMTQYLQHLRTNKALEL